MGKLHLKAIDFKKMSGPRDPDSPYTNYTKYVCYIEANSVPSTIDEWFGTNPREQKMTTSVAKDIRESLIANSNFHDLNRGIVLSAKDVKWNNATDELVLTLDDPSIHGNIDGGHTLRAILKAKADGTLPENRYVFAEIFEGLENPVDLAAARNTAVQVDLKSIEELKNSFSVLKDVFKELPFKDRIQYKMNEHYNDREGHLPIIDVRELIAIITMFNQETYPIREGFSGRHPIQTYSGKEATLRKFLNLGSAEKRGQIISNMKPIIPDIFNLWEKIETSFVEASSDAGKRYRARKYSKYDEGKEVGKSFVEARPLEYVVPKGLIYPLIGAFRALIKVDDKGAYSWKKNPITAWEALRPSLINTLLSEKTENPEVVAKNSNLWGNLFMQVYIYGLGQ